MVNSVVSVQEFRKNPPGRPCLSKQKTCWKGLLFQRGGLCGALNMSIRQAEQAISRKKTTRGNIATSANYNNIGYIVRNFSRVAGPSLLASLWGSALACTNKSEEGGTFIVRLFPGHLGLGHLLVICGEIIAA